MKLPVGNLEKEIDFQFVKLQDIELLCENLKLNHLVVAMIVQKKNYAKGDSDTILAEAIIS